MMHKGTVMRSGVGLIEGDGKWDGFNYPISVFLRTLKHRIKAERELLKRSDQREKYSMLIRFIEEIDNNTIYGKRYRDHPKLKNCIDLWNNLGLANETLQRKNVENGTNHETNIQNEIQAECNNRQNVYDFRLLSQMKRRGSHFSMGSNHELLDPTDEKFQTAGGPDSEKYDWYCKNNTVHMRKLLDLLEKFLDGILTKKAKDLFNQNLGKEDSLTILLMCCDSFKLDERDQQKAPEHHFQNCVATNLDFITSWKNFKTIVNCQFFLNRFHLYLSYRI